MHSIDWNLLCAPFPAEAVDWRVVELAPDRLSARVEPQLFQEAMVSRLNEACEPHNWSMRFRGLGQGVACELTVLGIVRSAVADPAVDEGPRATSLAAFAATARLFGLAPPVPPGGELWVDYDPDEKQAMFPDAAELVDDVRASTSPEVPDVGVPQEVPASGAKPEGQQAIDRLVDRLKQEGKGLEAARLLVDHGGYGRDPEMARELYRRLRELLSTVETRA